MVPRIRKRWVIVAVAALVVVTVGLLLPTIVGSWAPILHVNCDSTGSPISTFSTWAPAALVNSPYGGRAWDNGTVPPGPLSLLPTAGNVYGAAGVNGSANWAGFRVTVNVTKESNQTVWGPGGNVYCEQPFALSIRYLGGIALGLAVLGPGNRTDHAEPSTLNYTPYPGDVNLQLTNGFETANSVNVSTCGEPAKWSLPIAAASVVVGVPVDVGGHDFAIPYTFMFVQSFHYWFPADFGTWQIDNLSAPGGPGGGLAFSYSPCA